MKMGRTRIQARWRRWAFSGRQETRPLSACWDAVRKPAGTRPPAKHPGPQILPPLIWLIASNNFSESCLNAYLQIGCLKCSSLFLWVCPHSLHLLAFNGRPFLARWRRNSLSRKRPLLERYFIFCIPILFAFDRRTWRSQKRSIAVFFVLPTRYEQRGPPSVALFSQQISFLFSKASGIVQNLLIL